MTTTLTTAQLETIAEQAHAAGMEAAAAYAKEHYNGRDVGFCGFGVLYIEDVRGNTTLGKFLKSAGFIKAKLYPRHPAVFNSFYQLGYQAMDVNLAGVQAAAKVWNEHGIPMRTTTFDD